MKKGKKKIIDFYYRIKLVDGKEVKVPYEWKIGEQKEYENVCNNVEGWRGIPLDVNWATTTQSYIQTLKQLNTK